MKKIPKLQCTLNKKKLVTEIFRSAQNPAIHLISKQLQQLCYGVTWPNIHLCFSENKVLVITSKRKLCGLKSGQSFFSTKLPFTQDCIILLLPAVVKVTLQLSCTRKENSQLFFLRTKLSDIIISHNFLPPMAEHSR